MRREFWSCTGDPVCLDAHAGKTLCVLYDGVEFTLNAGFPLYWKTSRDGRVGINERRKPGAKNQYAPYLRGERRVDAREW